MQFRRTNTSVVHIGRRSGFDSDRRSEDAELGNAMFRCAVVSRKHAKIAFSDSGLVRFITYCHCYLPLITISSSRSTSLILDHITEPTSVNLERSFLDP